jgi:hypothetical protein
MPWRKVLIEWPAAIFDAWIIAYRLVLALLTLVAMGTVTATLVLWFVFGIRWGW